jgi:hypothetical protein
MSDYETQEYRQFTKPAELHKAVNTLKGIVAGITTDAQVSSAEIMELTNWCTLHEHLRNRHPFNELLPLVEAAYTDGIITDDETKDIVWLCNNFVSDANYYDLITSSIQFLYGLLHGIMADGKLEINEVRSLSRWLDTNEYLLGIYPFDEIRSLVVSSLSDGIIDAEEHEQLMSFFSNFIDLSASYNLREPELIALREKYDIKGICAMAPEITFQEHKFCLTGEFRRGKRKDIEALILEKSGVPQSVVSSKTDYVIVGNAGNACWAYACYGRKIEEAMALRQNGHKLLIINENDFWDAF